MNQEQITFGGWLMTQLEDKTLFIILLVIVGIILFSLIRRLPKRLKEITLGKVHIVGAEGQATLTVLQRDLLKAKKSLYYREENKRIVDLYRRKMKQLSQEIGNDFRTGFEKLLIKKGVPEDKVFILDDVFTLEQNLDLLEHSTIHSFLDDVQKNGFDRLDNDEKINSYLEEKKAFHRHNVKNILNSVFSPEILFQKDDGTFGPKTRLVTRAEVLELWEILVPVYDRRIGDIYKAVIEEEKALHRKIRDMKLDE